MATIRLIPSTYYLSSSSYLSVSNASNMYADTDSSAYATVTNSRSSTTSYYIYLRGFNFDDVPSGIKVNSFTIKLKAYESGVSTSSSYRPYICDGTTAMDGYCNAISSSVQTLTFTCNESWDDIVAAGSDFGIRINCRRASRNTTGYMYIYGAEIEVDYTVLTSATVTSTLSGNGTISPNGAYSTYEGIEYTLTITPTDTSETVTITNNGIDVTSQLVEHGSEATGSLVPNSYSTSGIQSGSSYAAYAVGHSAESPSSSGTSSNMYASSSSTGYAEYTFDFTDIPSNATIESVEAICYGHRESSTTSSTYLSRVAIVCDGTQISDEVEFPSTSNTTITATANSTVTRSQLDDVAVRHYVGYYGGLVLGITLNVTYSTGEGLDHYTYTYTVDGDATIAVVIGASGETTKLFVKISGIWQEVVPYKKVSGSWVQQSDLTTVFDSTKNYLKGN